MARLTLLLLFGVAWAAVNHARADDLAASAKSIPAEDSAFFESKVRPLLARRCYECHSQDEGKSKG
ncbi:MAG: hypothetical protein KDA55_14750, partial [Planctomycetales bacterium]|nr:hypothetical protein [Planctomycetales bacterium]